MISGSRVRIQAKCTTCQGTWTMTEAQQQQAREFGCPMSPCCMAVSTIVSIQTNRLKPKRKRA